VQNPSCAVARRPPPQETLGDLRLPSGKPFGLPDPEYPHSRAGCPSAPWSLGILPTETEANPEGCQRVAGGRSGQRGERPPEKRVGWLSTPERGARPNEATIGWLKSLGPQSKCLGSISGTHGRRVPAQFSGVTPISIPRGSNESGTPPGCKTPPAPLPGGRRPKKPSATSGYRLANPSGCLRKPPYRPGRTAAVSRVLQTDSQ
jgi:hypothetical protein